MTYTYSQMKKKYTNEQLTMALDEWMQNHKLRIKIVIALSKDGNQYKGHQMQYKGMEMIITREAYAL